ncbi:MAG TPA: hypothetical protein VF552_03970 [Allosphingosinicella sp.]
MPRYFFHVYDDVISHDAEGLELPNVAAARLKAIQGARDIIAEQVRHGHFVLSHWIEVLDETGETVLTLPFRDAVHIEE